MGLYAAARELGIEVEVVAAIDSWDRAVDVYNANLPHPVARVADVKQMAKSDFPAHDLVIGGPPCQPFSLAGKRNGHDDPRNCLPDFQRLALETPWLMENVIPRLIPSVPFSMKLNAEKFGDVTSRKRWFYSDHLLHVVETPGPRRIRDIRDYAEDERVIEKRSGCKAGVHQHNADGEVLASITAEAWHGHDVRGKGKLLAIPREGGFLGSLTQTSHHGHKNNGSGMRTKGSTIPTLRLGLRGNSASASAFEDDDFLGSLLSNAFHANEASKLEGCRNPSLLEMARAHSIPDSFDWCGVTKTAKGKMIANSWPIGMATAACRAMLVAMGAR